MTDEERAQRYIAAFMKRASLRISCMAFGVPNEAWVDSQLTDAERAILAREAERPVVLALPEAEHGA